METVHIFLTMSKANVIESVIESAHPHLSRSNTDAEGPP